MTTASTSTASRSPFAFLLFGGLAALTAAVAATTSLMLGLLPWAMFVGWVAWFTRPTSVRQGLATWTCLIAGLTLGALAALGVGALTAVPGGLALGLVVLVVAFGVVSMRAVPWLDNIPA
jgi:hypothetical protein